MNQKQLERLCQKWQKILRLQDWQVAVVFSRASNMQRSGSAGETIAEFGLKRAEIRLLDPIDAEDDKEAQELEATLVHELVHLHFWYFTKDFKSESPDYYLSEQAIDSIADALVNRAPAMR